MLLTHFPNGFGYCRPFRIAGIQSAPTQSPLDASFDTVSNFSTHHSFARAGVTRDPDNPGGVDQPNWLDRVGPDFVETLDDLVGRHVVGLDHVQITDALDHPDK